MSVEFRSLKELFLAALSVAPADRLAWLEGACGADLGLRRQLEMMLAAHESPLSLLDNLAPDAGRPRTATNPLHTAEPVPATVLAGTVLAGRYQLLEVIGEGGMGTVWLAQQTEPVKRQVAVKLIKPSADSKQVLARFEAERQALALMDHPNIARVLDAGAVPLVPEGSGGCPFFVMELVRGAPITEYCDEHLLTPRQRLELFIPVCQAIQHAHQKGIIHRDIKPRNVLVAVCDGKPVPKVIDFGVAKATGQPLTEQPPHTGLGSMVGTLEYMSPEQASFNRVDIDTRSDIYSLGVLLYELLTGAPPFPWDESVGMLDLLRMIHRQEPPRPSTKLSAPRLAALVRGEPDWIVMKALEKDPNRRYESASAFARDIERHLAGEPIQAAPPSAGYRLRKFVSRHRVPVFAATAVLVALMAGVVGTTLGMVEALDQKDKAEQARKSEEEQRQAAVKNAETATAEAARATTEWQRAEKELLRAEWLLYAGSITVAQQAWESNNVPLAVRSLGLCRQDFRGWEHDYLGALFHSNQRTLEGHTDTVLCVAFTPPGRHVVSAGYDKTVRVWDVATGETIVTFTGHTDRAWCVAVNPDGRTVASGGSDKVVRVWDLATGKELRKLTGHTSGLTGVAFSPDGLSIATSSFDRTLRIWDAATGQCKRTLTGHVHTVLGVAFSPDGKRVASAGGDNTGRVWDLATGEELQSFSTADGSGVGSVAFSPDGRSVAGGWGNGAVRVWDAATGREVRHFQGHKESIWKVVFSPDGKRLASASVDQTVRVWDMDAGTEVMALRGHTDQVLSAAFSPDGRWIVSAGGDRTVKLWDAAVSQGPLSIDRLDAQAASMTASPDGRLVACGSVSGAVKLFDATTGRRMRTLAGPRSWAFSLAFSPDGQRLACAFQEGVVKVWHAPTGEWLFDLPGRRMLGNYVAFSPDGLKIFGTGPDDTLKAWDAATGKEAWTTKRWEASGITGIAISPNGARLATARTDNKVMVWDVAIGKPTLLFTGHTGRGMVQAVAFSPKGDRIVTGGEDNTVRVWDAATGEQLLLLTGHTGPVKSVSVSPDGLRIASGSLDRTIKVWALDSGQEVLTLKGHRDGVTGVAFTWKGNRLVSSCHGDGAVKVWDAGAGRQRP